MAKEAKLKCLRCGYEYTSPVSDNTELEERTCPRCSSNSVRQIREEKKGED
ncbi:MAG TPA: hypothetical protein G4O06_06555 [Dehalococcoidia bacterium]|jgi:DNA-directed RNA polymerase subunit RPC12/RpoP|nr:hypothetical protein [Dehalococcoidia bacterium]